MMQISRRAMLSGIVLVMLGCRRPEEKQTEVQDPTREVRPSQDPEPDWDKGIYASDTEAEFAGMIRDRILEHLPADRPKKFDPLTIITIVGFIIRLIQVCKEEAISRQQQACKEKPNGGVARHLKKNMHNRYVSEHPTADPDDVEEHVDASLKAFVNATPEELKAAKVRADKFNNQPTLVELDEFVERLSRRDIED
jgi:hypothetical protein